MSITIDREARPDELLAGSIRKQPPRQPVHSQLPARCHGGWCGVVWKLALVLAALGGGWSLNHSSQDSTAHAVVITETVTRATLPIMVTECGELETLTELSQMHVKVRVHESKVTKIRVGQKAEVRLEAYPNTLLHGTVVHVATLADAAASPHGLTGVKEYVSIVKIDDSPPHARLRPSTTGEVRIRAKEIPDALLVPIQALANCEGHHVVYVVGRFGTVARREVVIGDNNENSVQIIDGLSEGERVVVDAQAWSAAEANAGMRRLPP
jgi:multidrug efflux pump subunit AcrA (membrane-fusion protein)